MRRIVALPSAFAVPAPLLAPRFFPGRVPAQDSPPRIVLGNPVLDRSDIDLSASFSEDPDPERRFGPARSGGVADGRAMAVMTKLSAARFARGLDSDPQERRSKLRNWPASADIDGMEFKTAYSDDELNSLDRHMSPLERARERIDGGD